MSSNLNLQVESLRHITEISQESINAKNKVAILDVPKEPKGTYGIVFCDGTFEVRHAAPPHREHRLLSVDQIPLIVGAFSVNSVPYVDDDDPSVKARLCQPSVWVSEEAVIVLEDDTPDSPRYSRAICPLKVTPEFDFLRKASQQEVWKQQRDFIRLLRINLADAMGDQLDILVNQMRSIKFGAKMEGSGRVERGSDAYGKSIEAQVYSDKGQLPEDILIDVRVFNDPALKVRYTIRVALEIDTAQQAFALMPSPQAVSDLMDQAVAGVLSLYDSVDCPKYLGTP